MVGAEYSAPHNTGMPTDWHLVHQGQFAIRGYGLVFTEATAVLDNGGMCVISALANPG